MVGAKALRKRSVVMGPSDWNYLCWVLYSVFSYLEQGLTLLLFLDSRVLLTGKLQCQEVCCNIWPYSRGFTVSLPELSPTVLKGMGTMEEYSQVTCKQEIG